MTPGALLRFEAASRVLTICCDPPEGGDAGGVQGWVERAAQGSGTPASVTGGGARLRIAVRERSQHHQGLEAVLQRWLPLVQAAEAEGLRCVGVVSEAAVPTRTIERWAGCALAGELLWTPRSFDAFGGSASAHWAHCDALTLDLDAGPVRLMATRARERSVVARPMETVLIGRRLHRQLLRRALDGVASPHEAPIAMLLVGEAGMGKTTLLAEASAHAAERSIAEIRTHCVDYPQLRREEPVGRFVCGLLGVLPASADDAVLRSAAAAACASVGQPGALPLLLDLLDVPMTDPERAWLSRFVPAQLLRARAALLASCVARRASEGPLVLVFEDLHWGTETVFELIEALLDLAADAPMCILATTRPHRDPTPDRPRLADAFSRLELGPLPALEARRLAMRLSESRRKPWQVASPDFLDDQALEECLLQAGGNPLYLTQLLRLGGEDRLALRGEGSLDELLSHRTRLLGQRERRLLEVAACVGFYFDAARCCDLAGADAADLAALEAANLVVVADGRHRFAHALIRDSVLDSLLDARRAAIHRALAESETDPMLRAEWWSEVGDPRAFAGFIAVAEQRRAAYQWVPALAALERASEMAQAPLEQAQASALRGRICEEQGDGARSLRHFEDAQRAVVAAGAAASSDLTIRASLGVLAAYRLLGRLDDADRVIGQLRRRMDGPVWRRENPELSAQLDTLRGAIAFSRGDLVQCQRAQESAIRTLESATPPLTESRLYAKALSGMGDALYAQGAFAEAREVMARCVHAARAQGQGRIEVSTLHMLGIVTAYAGDPVEGERLARACWESACEVGDARAMLFSELNIALTRFWGGGASDALEPCRGGIERADWLGSSVLTGMTRSFTGHVYLEAGDRSAAARDADLARTHMAQNGERLFGGVCLGLSLALAAADGDAVHDERVGEWLDAGLDLLGSAVISHNYLYFALGAVPAAWARGDIDTLWRLLGVMRDFFGGEVEDHPEGAVGATTAWLMLHLCSLGEAPSADPAALQARVEGQPLLRRRDTWRRRRP